jgi:peptide/nickel transport system substrate-binding protein
VKLSVQYALHALCVLILFGLNACGEPVQNEPGASAESTPARGGSATVLLSAEFAGSWPTGLDPATNTTGGANLSQMIAIYGGLFQLTANSDGSDPQVKGVLAQGYEFFVRE